MKTNLNLKLKKFKKELLEVEKEIRTLKEDVDWWEDEFSTFLDENYGEVEILGNTYGMAWALKRLDKIAYNEELSNWCDENIDDEMIYNSDIGDAELIERRDELIEKISDLEKEIENSKD